MGTGLVLGGGGVVGVAWEVGILAGLIDAGRLDLDAVDVIVGTSAGSVVGARLLLGTSLDELVEEQLSGPSPVGDGLNGPAMADPRQLMAIFQEWGGTQEMTPETAASIGAKAMVAATASEEAWLENFVQTGIGAEWPEGRDLRTVSVSCTTGRRAVWTAASGIPLTTAVAASCAVPGLFPTVTIDGDSHTDGGVWSPTSADVVIGSGVGEVTVVGPMVGGPGGVGSLGSRTLDAETKALADAGIGVTTIIPDEAFHAAGMNLMDPARRAEAYNLGFVLGRS